MDGFGGMESSGNTDVMKMMTMMSQGGGKGMQGSSDDTNMNMMSMFMNMMSMMAQANGGGGGGGGGGCKGFKGGGKDGGMPGGKTKRKICQFFVEGRCAKGSNCTFAHGEHELGMPQGSGVLICQFFAQGKCEKGALCTFSHGDDMETAFSSGAVASRAALNFGPRAQAIAQGQTQAYPPQSAQTNSPQLDDELATLDQEMAAIQKEIDRLASGGEEEPLQNSWEASSEGALQAWSQGFGSTLGQAPQGAGGQGFVPKKVKMCTFFEQGRCSKGSACTYAHGEHELGMPQPSGFTPNEQWPDWSARSSPY